MADAAHPKPRIEHRGLIRPHTAGADRRQVGDVVSANGGPKLGIGIHVLAPDQFSGDIIRECRLIDDLARQPHSGGQRLQIVLGFQEVEADSRGRERISALYSDLAARVGAQMHRTDGEAREGMREDPFPGPLGKAPQAEIELNVGPFEALVAAGKAAGAGAPPPPTCARRAAART